MGSAEWKVGGRSQNSEARSKNSAVGAGPCARPDERLICRVCRGEKSFALSSCSSAQQGNPGLDLTGGYYNFSSLDCAGDKLNVYFIGNVDDLL